MGLAGTTRSKRFWKAIAVGVLVSWIFTGYVWYATWESFVSSKPRQMEIASGRTIPLSSHGIVVYLTVSERDRLKLLNRCCYGFTFAFFLIYMFKKPFGNTEEDNPRTST
jgi:hypothetical protein